MEDETYLLHPVTRNMISTVVPRMRAHKLLMVVTRSTETLSHIPPNERECVIREAIRYLYDKVSFLTPVEITRLIASKWFQKIVCTPEEKQRWRSVIGPLLAGTFR